MQLFEHGGIAPGIRRAFVVYLASHNPPIHEVLFSRPLDVRLEYERTFVGTTADPAVRWKLQNLQRLAASSRKKFDEMVNALDERLQRLP